MHYISVSIQKINNLWSRHFFPFFAMLILILGKTEQSKLKCFIVSTSLALDIKWLCFTDPSEWENCRSCRNISCTKTTMSAFFLTEQEKKPEVNCCLPFFPFLLWNQEGSFLFFGIVWNCLERPSKTSPKAVGLFTMGSNILNNHFNICK